MKFTEYLASDNVNKLKQAKADCAGFRAHKEDRLTLTFQDCYFIQYNTPKLYVTQPSPH